MSGWAAVGEMTPELDFTEQIQQIQERIDRERGAAARLQQVEKALRDIIEFERVHPYQGYARAMARIAQAALAREEPANGSRPAATRPNEPPRRP
jgi:hypothetical protein